MNGLMVEFLEDQIRFYVLDSQQKSSPEQGRGCERIGRNHPILLEIKPYDQQPGSCRELIATASPLTAKRIKLPRKIHAGRQLQMTCAHCLLERSGAGWKIEVG
jgi:hypothetical protein